MLISRPITKYTDQTVVYAQQTAKGDFDIHPVSLEKFKQLSSDKNFKCRLLTRVIINQFPPGTETLTLTKSHRLFNSIDYA